MQVYDRTRMRFEYVPEDVREDAMKRDSLLREKERRRKMIVDFSNLPTPDFIKNMHAIVINEDSLKNIKPMKCFPARGDLKR